MNINLKPIVVALAAALLSAGAVSAQTIVKADSVTVYFEYNKSEFNPIYKGNGAAMDKLVRDVRTHDAAPEYIIINSSSSPEGPADSNARLTIRRKESMLQYLSGQVDIEGVPVQDAGVSIDWERMKRLVIWDVAMPLKYKTKVLEKLNGDDPSGVTELYNSSAWDYLMKNIFPKMRCSEIVFVWETEKPAEVVDEPGQGTQNTQDTQDTEEENLAFDIPYNNPSEPETPTEPEEPVSTETPAEPQQPSGNESGDDSVFVMPKIEASWKPALEIKVNALSLPLLISNIGVEIQPWEHWSFNIPVYYTGINWFSKTRKFRVLATQPEVRYWLKEDMSGLFFNVHGGTGIYNVAWGSNYRYQNRDQRVPAWDAGIGIGYKKRLGNTRWGLEAGIGAGFVPLDYDYYYNMENGRLAGSGKTNYFGVDQAFISLTYQLIRFKSAR